MWYYNDKNIRKNVNELIKCGKKLSLYFSQSDEVGDTIIDEVHQLSLAYKLEFSCCDDIENVDDLKSVHTLSFEHCNNIKDVSALSGVYDLRFEECDGILNVDALGHVHK